ncbi:MAG TPA: hypothetical protein VFU22_06340, partial [Roseiflexaceae bacterium]|nr:hypothetical protein [Roseiflexaceae bacterium]
RPRHIHNSGQPLAEGSRTDLVSNVDRGSNGWCEARATTAAFKPHTIGFRLTTQYHKLEANAECCGAGDKEPRSESSNS